MPSDLSFIFREAVAFWETAQASSSFFVLKLFLSVYSIVLLADVVLLLLLRDVGADLRKTLYGSTKHPLVRKSKIAKRWSEIELRMKSENMSQYKAAIIEADALASQMLHDIGYGGENMKERIEAVKNGEIASIEEVKAAHIVRNRIIHEPEFAIEREEATNILGKYEVFFKELELL